MAAFGSYSKSRPFFLLTFLIIAITSHWFWRLAKEGILLPSPRLIFSLSDTDIYWINHRRSNYAYTGVSRLFENKIEYVIRCWEKNFLEFMDVGVYFFAGHPRERAGVDEYEKFSFLLLPVFIVGLIKIIKEKCMWLVAYFLAFISIASFFQNAAGYSFFLFPWFVTVISIGIGVLLSKIKYEEN